MSKTRLVKITVPVTETAGAIKYWLSNVVLKEDNIVKAVIYDAPNNVFKIDLGTPKEDI